MHILWYTQPLLVSTVSGPSSVPGGAAASLEGPQDGVDGIDHYVDFNHPEPQSPRFTYTRAPRRAYYSPSYHQFESPNPGWDASPLTPADPTDDELIAKATSDAYLTLYQHGSLKVRVNSAHTWELQCPHGCWVKTSVRGHIPLSNKGQFFNLESHWGTKSCVKSTATQEHIWTSHFALVTTFPSTPPLDSTADTCSSLNGSLWVTLSWKVHFSLTNDQKSLQVSHFISPWIIWLTTRVQYLPWPHSW